MNDTEEDYNDPYEEVDEQPNVKPVEDVAREVIAGHWGRGNVRRKRLTDAGWDADAIQAEVTRIFKEG